MSCVLRRLTDVSPPSHQQRLQNFFGRLLYVERRLINNFIEQNTGGKDVLLRLVEPQERLLPLNQVLRISAAQRP